MRRMVYEPGGIAPMPQQNCETSCKKCSRDLKMFKAWIRGFFQGKMFIRNISGYNDEIETKFGTWTDFTALNICK